MSTFKSILINEIKNVLNEEMPPGLATSKDAPIKQRTPRSRPGTTPEGRPTTGTRQMVCPGLEWLFVHNPDKALDIIKYYLAWFYTGEGLEEARKKHPKVIRRHGHGTDSPNPWHRRAAFVTRRSEGDNPISGLPVPYRSLKAEFFLAVGRREGQKYRRKIRSAANKKHVAVIEFSKALCLHNQLFNQFLWWKYVPQSFKTTSIDMNPAGSSSDMVPWPLGTKYNANPEDYISAAEAFRRLYYKTCDKNGENCVDKKNPMVPWPLKMEIPEEFITSSEAVKKMLSFGKLSKPEAVKLVESAYIDRQQAFTYTASTLYGNVKDFRRVHKLAQQMGLRGTTTGMRGRITTKKGAIQKKFDKHFPAETLSQEIKDKYKVGYGVHRYILPEKAAKIVFGEIYDRVPDYKALVGEFEKTRKEYLEDMEDYEQAHHDNVNNIKPWRNLASKATKIKRLIVKMEEQVKEAKALLNSTIRWAKVGKFFKDTGLSKLADWLFLAWDVVMVRGFLAALFAVGGVLGVVAAPSAAFLTILGIYFGVVAYWAQGELFDEYFGSFLTALADVAKAASRVVRGDITPLVPQDWLPQKNPDKR